MSITVHNILVSIDSTRSEAKATADKWTVCVSASEADAVGHTIQAHAVDPWTCPGLLSTHAASFSQCPFNHFNLAGMMRTSCDFLAISLT